MSTDLHAALRDAVAEEPFDESDVRAVVETGSRRLRRRTAVRVGASVLGVAVAAALTSVVAGRGDQSDPDPAPQPTQVIRLDLTKATEQPLDVLASVRTTWRDANSIDYEHFEGLTADGLILRSRYTYAAGGYELGLLDPATGSTDWLPPVSAGQGPTVAVDLTADRLVLVTRNNGRRSTMSIFDRKTRSWQTSTMRLPAAGLEVHVPPRLTYGSDDRLYFGSTFEGESGPISWWSFAVPEGGVGRPEPDLAGAAVAWGDRTRVTAYTEGRVVLSGPGTDQVVANALPPDCALPTDDGFIDAPLIAGLAGTLPVVSYWCGDPPRAVTVVYDVEHGDALEVAGAFLLAARGNYVLLSGPETDHGDPGGLYLLDTATRTLNRIGPGTHEAQVGFADGLVLWNEPGPIDDNDVYDVIWKVGRLPQAG